jgi:hypothetical protein
MCQQHAQPKSITSHAEYSSLTEMGRRCFVNIEVFSHDVMRSGKNARPDQHNRGKSKNGG